MTYAANTKPSNPLSAGSIPQDPLFSRQCFSSSSELQHWRDGYGLCLLVYNGTTNYVKP